MSITNFTPGPWPLEVGEKIAPNVQQQGFVHVPYKHTIETNIADARLIACAPELYTILDAFLSDYEERGEIDYKLRQRAQAVLDKAVGRGGTI